NSPSGKISNSVSIGTRNMLRGFAPASISSNSRPSCGPIVGCGGVMMRRMRHRSIGIWICTGKTVRGKIYGCDPIDAPGQCSFSLNKLLGRVPRLFGWDEQGNGHPSLGKTENPFPQPTQITRKTVDVVISTFPI